MKIDMPLHHEKKKLNPKQTLEFFFPSRQSWPYFGLSEENSWFFNFQESEIAHKNTINLTGKLLKMKADMFFYHMNKNGLKTFHWIFLSGPSNLVLFRAVTTKSSWFLVGGFGRQPLYDEMGAAARNIHCYTVI